MNQIYQVSPLLPGGQNPKMWPRADAELGQGQGWISDDELEVDKIS